MAFVLDLLGFILVVAALGFNIGWAVTDGSKGHPWNWRVFLGPGAYLDWLEKRVPDWWRH